MAALKGYLPPSGPAHGVPYRWIASQHAHHIGNSVVEHSAEDIIVTVDETAQRACERSGLEQVPQSVAEDALDAIRDDDMARANEVVAEWQNGDTEDGGDTEAEDGSEAEDERPAIPDDDTLESLPYRGETGDESADSLQDLAEAYGIRANQSADELRAALADERDAEGR